MSDRKWTSKTKPRDRCWECERVIPDKKEMREHLIKDHGYEAIEGGVGAFKRRFCSWCPKVALYRNGSRRACKEHYPIFIEERKALDKGVFLPRTLVREERKQSIDSLLKDKDGARTVAKFGHKGAGGMRTFSLKGSINRKGSI